MALSLHHTAITTRNYNNMLSFYQDILGGELIRESQWEKGQTELDARTGLTDSVGRVALLKFGQAYFEIFEFTNPLIIERADVSLAHPGITHFALSCEDCFVEYERLKKAGMIFNAPPWKTPAGGVFTFGSDPDGNIIEIIQPADPGA